MEAFWSHSKVKVHCDNMAVVQVVDSGKTKDPYLAACLRHLWLLTASYDSGLEVEHIQGSKNIIADLLSRLYSDKPTDVQLFTHLNQEYIWDKIRIQDLKIDFNI